MPRDLDLGSDDAGLYHVGHLGSQPRREAQAHRVSDAEVGAVGREQQDRGAGEGRAEAGESTRRLSRAHGADFPRKPLRASGSTERLPAASNW